MPSGSIVPLCFAAPLAICLLVREIRWRYRLKNWMMSEGEVVGYSQKSEEDGVCPIIAYIFREKEREQICEFNLNHYRPGEVVPILINPASGKIFIATYQDRWFLSVFLLGCVAALFFLSYASYSSTDH
jgi:hypothetical protein